MTKRIQIHLNPNDSHALNNSGIVYYKMKEYETEKNIYQEVSWYGLLLSFPTQDMFIARKDPDDGHSRWA